MKREKEREIFGKCKNCHGGIYHISGEKGGRPPEFCSDECKAEHSQIKRQERSARAKRKRKYKEEVGELMRPKGKQANKTLDEILADLKSEGKGPGDFGEYKRLKALEQVTPIVL